LSLEKFGIYEGINEIIATTRTGESINSAPLGIRYFNKKAYVMAYSDTHTFANLKESGVLVANVIHDPVIFAISSFDDLAREYYVDGKYPILKDALSYVVFSTSISGKRVDLSFIEGKVLRKEVRAINRGLNAIIEACIYGTRYLAFGSDELKNRVVYYLSIAEKCGSNQEKKAIELIKMYLDI
jgi:hypothetical protein